MNQRKTMFPADTMVLWPNRALSQFYTTFKTRAAPEVGYTCAWRQYLGTDRTGKHQWAQTLVAEHPRLTRDLRDAIWVWTDDEEEEEAVVFGEATFSI